MALVLKMKNKNVNRAILVSVFIIFISLWVLINSGQLLFAGIIYIAVPIVSIFLYKQWDLFGKKGKLEGINEKWIKDFFLWGVLPAGGFIGLSQFIPGLASIGLPNVQSIAGDLGRILITVIAAPVSEELFFRDLFHDFFESKLNLSFFIAAVITSLAFAMYHFVAYGESLRNSGGSFFTAALAGLGFSYLNKITKSNAGNIGAHMTLNLYLVVIKLGLISFA